MVRPGGILLLGTQSRRWPMPNRCFLMPLHLRFLRPMISPPYRYTGPVINPLIINTWDIAVAIPNTNAVTIKAADKGSSSNSFLIARINLMTTPPLRHLPPVVRPRHWNLLSHLVYSGHYTAPQLALHLLFGQVTGEYRCSLHPVAGVNNGI